MEAEKRNFKDRQELKQPKERYNKALAKRRKVKEEVEAAKLEVRRLKTRELAKKGGPKRDLAQRIAEELGWMDPNKTHGQYTNEELTAYWQLYNTPRPVLDALAKALGLLTLFSEPEVEQ